MTSYSKGTCLLYYLASVFGSVVLSILALRLWEFKLTVPLSTYSEDVMYGLGMVKGILDNGWILDNRFLGMPVGQSLPVDFPSYLVQVVPFFTMKVIGLFTDSAPLVVNIYFLATFPLIALFSMICFRQMDIDLRVCLVGSLLYAFLPYHFARGERHLILSGYYVVPLAVMVSLWVYRGQALLIEASGPKRMRMSLRGCRRAGSIAACIVIGATQEYYAFFACFFLVIAGIMGSTSRRNVSHLLTALSLVAIIAVTLLATLSPAILNTYQNGKNTEVAARVPQETEVYGLKIVQMLLPVSGHRVEALRQLRTSYDQGAPMVNENNWAALGLVGSLGFLILILWPLVGRNPVPSAENDAGQIMNFLSKLTIYGVLLATVGGFSSLFAFAVSPLLRCYNRISVYIALFALAAILLLITSALRRCTASFGTTLIAGISLALLLALGLLDQIPRGITSSFHETEAEYASDAQLVSRIETSLPAEAMIFQLPYFPFPEHPPIHRMADYSHLKGYLHSKALRWSYGAVRGRLADLWQRKNYVEKPLPEGVENLVAVGFSGIYIDRFGYADSGAAMQENLTKLLNSSPIESPNKRLIFFDLREYCQRLRVKYGTDEWERKRLLMKAHPLSLDLGQSCTFHENGTGLVLIHNGFSQPEKNFTWTCAKEATILVALPPVTGDVEMTLEAIPFEKPQWQKPRYVDVFCNDAHVARWPLLPNGQGMAPIEYKAQIKRALLKPGRTQRISFRFSSAISPKMLGMSEDSRLLGLAFMTVTFKELPIN
jgi:hypothetical protein